MTEYQLLVFDSGNTCFSYSSKRITLILLLKTVYHIAIDMSSEIGNNYAKSCHRRKQLVLIGFLIN